MDFIRAHFGSIHEEPSDITTPPKHSYASAVFKLPIDHLLDDVYELSPVVASDLELVLGENPVYESLTENDSEFARQILPKFQHKYTTNVTFLEDTQRVIESVNEGFFTATNM